MRIAIITAMDKETMPLLQKIGHVTGSEIAGGNPVYRFFVDPHDIFMITSGIGEIQAAAATQLAIDKYEAQLIINIGYAGAISHDLRVGEIVVAERVVHHQFDLSGIDNLRRGQYENRQDVYFNLSKNIIDMLESVIGGYKKVTVASGVSFIASNEDKKRLRENFKADICDMELAGIAIVALKNKVPVFSIKLLSDNADNMGKETYSAFVKSGLYESNANLASILRALK